MVRLRYFLLRKSYNSIAKIKTISYLNDFKSDIQYIESFFKSKMKDRNDILINY